MNANQNSATETILCDEDMMPTAPVRLDAEMTADDNGWTVSTTLRGPLFTNLPKVWATKAVCLINDQVDLAAQNAEIVRIAFALHVA